MREDPKAWAACVQWDKELAAKYPNATYDARLDTVGQLGRKVFGTAESRAIREMKLQRHPNLKPEDLDYVPEESATEFDQEHDAGISEAIDELRKGRAGIPLSQFKRQRPGTSE